MSEQSAKTRAQHRGLVPDPDYCVVLRESGMPQDKSRFYWATSGIVTKQGDDIWILLGAEELEGAGQKINEGQCYAAPVVEEFMKMAPIQFYVTHANGLFIFVDLLRTATTKTEDPEKKINTTGITLFRIRECDSKTAADCWAKGLAYLVFKKIMEFKKPKTEEAAETTAPPA